jgi:hypothetical protein
MAKDRRQTVEHIHTDRAGRVDEAQLVEELEALKNPRVRTYSVYGGEEGQATGVYAWDDKAPPGEYHHKALTDKQAEKVEKTILDHVAPAVLTRSAMIDGMDISVGDRATLKGLLGVQ